MNDPFSADVAPTSSAERAHLVQFYEEDVFLLDVLSRFIGEALAAGEAAIVIATQAHREGLDERLLEAGVDVERIRAAGRFVVLDAEECLSQFMVDGWPDEARFHRVVGGVVEQALGAAWCARVRAFGEMVALLCAAGNSGAALRLEELWNELARTVRFTLLCAYPLKLFGSADLVQPFLDICNAHSHVTPSESFLSLRNSSSRYRQICQLQQQASALEVEAVRRINAESSLQRKQDELADFLENAVEGLQQIGPQRQVLWANKALLQLLGYDAEEYVGHCAADFYAKRLVFDELWIRLLRRESVYDYPAELVCKDGSIRHVLIHSNALWEGETLVSTRCFVRDVTEQKRLDSELQAKLAQLADADRRKDEFLAMLGHELRNPLAAVRNAITTATLDDSRRSRALDIARRQADQLGRLIDDLLDVARITQGRIALRTSRESLASIVDRAIESTRSFIDERGHRFTVSLPATEIAVDADAARLEQVVVNLLTNAAKYTEPGGHIQLHLEREEEWGVLRVRDSGMGIAPEVVPRVFDLFSQAERALDRSQGGLGVGLTIARRLVDLHGGCIEAHSDGLGKGSEFVVRLPVPPESREPATKRGRQPANMGRARVLIVEDNPDAAESLMMLLELLGHHVRVLGDGAAALEAARANVPDVMLVDIGLPGIDGYEVARRVRSDPSLEDVVLVALTGYGSEDHKHAAMAAGFDYHVAKPVNIDALQDLVTRVARQESARPMLQ